MVKKINVKEYQKPGLICIDDPAFNETGQGFSGCYSYASSGSNSTPCKDLGGHLICLNAGKICNNGTCVNGMTCNGVR